MSNVKETMDGPFFNYGDKSAESKIKTIEVEYTINCKSKRLQFTSSLMNATHAHTHIISHFWYLKPIKVSH